jgi:hypothetical protein
MLVKKIKIKEWATCFRPMANFSVRVFTMAIAISLFAVSCGDDGDKPQQEFTFADLAALEQTDLYADDTEGTSLTFTTTGAWTSSYKTVVKAAGDEQWVFIEPDSGDKAGEYTVVVVVRENGTGNDRSAVITLTCGNEKQDINVTQKATPRGTVNPGNGVITISNLPAVSGETAVCVYDYSEDVNQVSYMLLYGANMMLAEGSNRSGSTVSLYSASGSSRFSRTGIYAVYVIKGEDDPGMYFGQVQFTGGSASIDYAAPSYDPNPCAPYHTGGEIIDGGYGDHDGWPVNLSDDLAALGVSTPEVMTRHGYDFGWDGDENGATVIYITVRWKECDDPSDYEEIMDAVYAQLGVGTKTATIDGGYAMGPGGMEKMPDRHITLSGEYIGYPFTLKIYAQD